MQSIKDILGALIMLVAVAIILSVVSELKVRNLERYSKIQSRNLYKIFNSVEVRDKEFPSQNFTRLYWKLDDQVLVFKVNPLVDSQVSEYNSYTNKNQYCDSFGKGVIYGY